MAGRALTGQTTRNDITSCVATSTADVTVSQKSTAKQARGRDLEAGKQAVESQGEIHEIA